MADGELDDALNEAAERWMTPERHGIPPADRARAHRLPPVDDGPNPWFSNPVWVDAADDVRAHRMDRDRHLWVGEWKDPEPPTAGQEER